MSEPELNLPAIHTQILSVDELRSMLDELHEQASQVTIQVKGGGFHLAESQDMELQEIGNVVQQKKAVQVRYVRNQVLWSDTYSMTAEGIQLVRFKLPAGL